MTLESRQQEQELRANRSLGRLGALASVLIAMQVGIALLFLVPSINNLFFAPVLENELGPDYVFLMVLGFGILAFYLGAAVAFVVWMRRAALNLRLLHPNGGFEFSPGWCVGWWFVPFASLVKPFQAMHEIWHYSDPDAEHVDPETGYTRQVRWGKQAPRLLLAWWTSWLIMTVLDSVLSAASDTVPGLILSGGVSASAAVTCLLVIRQVTSMQRDSFLRRAGGPRVASAIGHVVGVVD